MSVTDAAAAVEALDAKIADFRAQKAKAVAALAAAVADEELQAKLGRLSPEEWARVVVKPPGA